MLPRQDGPLPETNRLKKRLQALAVSLLGLLLLAWFFKGADFSAIRESLGRARPSLILSAAALTMVTYFLRAVRWSYLLRPLGFAGLGPLFTTTVIGFAMNFLLPTGRVGELARPYLLARKAGFSASSTFATVFLERLFDLVTVVVLVGFWLVVGDEPPGADGGEAVRALKLGGAVAASGCVVGLAFLSVAVRNRDRALSWLGALARRLPRRAATVAIRFTESFTVGLNVLKDPTALALAGALSILLWINIALALWCGAQAFGVLVSVGDNFLVIGFLVVGVAVPTPGAVGGYHVMYALALTMLFGVEANVAKAAALVNHLIAFVPVSILGVALLSWQKLSFGDVKRLVSSAETAEVK